MAWPLAAPNEEQVRWFVEESIAQRRNLLGRGYQASIYLWPDVDPPLVIKAATGHGPARWLRAWMLRREHRAYERLGGVRGIPRCFGLVDGRFLVLEFLEGIPRQEAVIEDRERFFAELLALIEEMHRRGVAHGDLQKRDNLLVLQGRHPGVIDFGASVIRKEGATLVNRWMFDFLSRLDSNTWVKLKYAGRIADATEADLAHYHRTWIEKAARAVKRFYTAPRRWWRRRRAPR